MAITVLSTTQIAELAFFIFRLSIVKSFEKFPWQKTPSQKSSIFINEKN